MLEVAGVGRTIALFALAGVAEIGGGWLVWQWLRVDRPWPLGVMGALVLVSYGVIPTFQEEAAFGRVYAAYGGVFVVLAMGWGWLVDGWRPAPRSVLSAWPSSCSPRGMPDLYNQS